MEDKKLINIVIILFLVAFGVRYIIKNLHDPTVYKGSWYTVKIPEGWQKRQEKDEVLFISPEVDVLTDTPYAIFSIYTKAAQGALFIEDYMQQVFEMLSQANGQIVDKGEIKVDEEIAQWVLFHQHEPALVYLTFYVVDDYNRLTRIQFVSTPNKFQKYREEFEKFKGSLKFKRLFKV